MKKLIIGASLLCMAGLAHSQNGLESIIVEKYYISDKNDTAVNSIGGKLPIGSVTYRVYADMLPGFKFQAAYGVPGHELRIETSTLFFNNEDRGVTTANAIAKTQLKNNTVMLDSWLSVGAASAGNFGILKVDDSGTTTNADGVLQNANVLAGVPLTTADGLVVGTPEAVTTVGITSEMGVFDAQNDGTNGPLFSTSNGSWASLNGATGPDANNRVLIAQITTDGLFKFELNIQIGTSAGGVQNYVARNPVGNEIVIPSLIYPTLTGIAQKVNVTSSATVNMYPNPANDQLTLEIFTPKKSNVNSYTIYGIEGNVLLTKQLGTVLEKQIENVDISSLDKGMYFIQLSIDGTTSTKRIIKN